MVEPALMGGVWLGQAWYEGGQAVLHGINPLQRDNRQAAAARALVERAHRQGRLVRFWGHGDNPAGWQVCPPAFLP